MVWAPDTKWAEEVIEECAAFPLGEHDDLVDSMTQAVMRFRQGGFVDHPEDYEDEPLPQQQRTYY
jgi:phage terminase large subunit-like protein